MQHFLIKISPLIDIFAVIPNITIHCSLEINSMKFIEL